jgi:DDE superfamily endonuclease
VTLQLSHRACELPEQAGRAVSQRDGTALAHQLVLDGIVAALAPQTIQRSRARCRLQPWRSHRWLPVASAPSRTPRDAAFVPCLHELADLSTRPLAPSERVLCLDEMTSLQPRPRRAPTRPARPGDPVQLEHEYRRDGALHLFAAFDTRRGALSAGQCRRTRQVECIACRDHLHRGIPAPISTVHIVCANVSLHHGKRVRAWLAVHPRFVVHFTPVPCSWMNPVEPWGSIRRRKRLRNVNFAGLTDLAAKIAAFIDQWNATTHPFRWTATSFDCVLATVEAALSQAA